MDGLTRIGRKDFDELCLLYAIGDTAERGGVASSSKSWNAECGEVASSSKSWNAERREVATWSFGSDAEGVAEADV